MLHNADIPEGLDSRQRILKRTFDIAVASAMLLVFLPLIVLGWAVSTFSTRQNGFFFHQRIGRWGKPFFLVKLRTMRTDEKFETTVTTRRDPRITPIGRILRRSKLDELPQLWNVIVGDMSLVGPRPDVPGFADQLEGQDRIVLSVRPGVTGPASLAFRNEENLLADQPDPEAYNRETIWPQKVRINREYLANWSLASDLRLLWQTAFPRNNS